LLEIIRLFLQSKELFEKCRRKKNFFIRNRVLTFHKIILFILNLIRKSLQIELFSFAKRGEIKEVSKQAFSKARRKLDPIVFKLLNQKLIQEFYTDNEIKTFHGFRILSVDGSQIHLPSSKELINYYGTWQNKNKKTPMGQASMLFDVLNKITVDSTIVPYKTSERDLALEHIKNIIEINKDTGFVKNGITDLFLFDRGYPSMELIISLCKNKKDFIMRCPRLFLNAVKKAVNKGKQDQIIEIKFADLSESAQARIKQKTGNFNENKIIQARVLLFELKSGEQEILLTSLLDQKEYLPIDFFNLYSMRWDIEENYKFQKSIAEMENFSGKSKLTIEQDFFATVFTCNFTSILMQEAQDEMNEALEHKKYKHKYKINRNLGLGLLKDELIKVILSNENLDKFCEKVKFQMKKYLVPIRPGRSFPHPRAKGKTKRCSMNCRSGI